MSDVAVQHGVAAAGVYEPSLFGTYSKKIGMWLFLLSDSLTFGALLWAYTYGRVSTPNWPTPFHSTSIVNATIMTAFLLTSSLTMVLERRHNCGVDNTRGMEWSRPARRRNTAVTVGIQQCAKRQRVGHQEQPHPDLLR